MTLNDSELEALLTDGQSTDSEASLDESALNQTVSFRAAGAERKMTVKEALEYAKKGFGAEAAFREAAELRKRAEEQASQAEKALAWQKDLEAARQGDMEAFRRVAGDWGIPEDQVEQIVATHAQNEGRIGQPGSQPALPPNVMRTISRMEALLNKFDQAGIDPYQDLATVKQFAGMELDGKSRQAVKAVLDKDPVFGKMLGSPDSGQAILSDVWDRVQRRVQSGAPFNVQTIQEAAKQVRGLLDAFDKTLPPSQAGPFPGSFGSVPTSSLATSRLQPPVKPNIDDFKDDLSGYIDARTAWDSWQASQSA